MSIVIDNNTKLLIQGITGYQGQYHSKAMMDFGTKVRSEGAEGPHEAQKGQETAPGFALLAGSMQSTCRAALHGQPRTSACQPLAAAVGERRPYTAAIADPERRRL